MHAKNSIVDNGSSWEHIEAKAEFFPNLNSVPSFALVVESIHSIDGLALVVASQQVEVLGELDLVGEEQGYGFNTLLSTIHIVANKEELLIVLRIPGNVK